MFETILFLWQQSTKADVLFALESVSNWPPETVRRLHDSGLLVDGGRAKYVSCDSCHGDHVEPIEWRDNGSEVNAFIRCPEYGPIRIDLERLQQWKLDPFELAKQTAKLLAPNLSSERFQRIKSGRFTREDRLEILELLTGHPSEASLAQRRKTSQNSDEARLANATEGLSPQLTLLLRCLWPRRGEVYWSDLDNTAFDEGPARKSETVFEALKRLRDYLKNQYDRLFLTLSVSTKKQTVKLTKDPLPKKGK